MGTRGRPPTPSAILKLHGSDLPRRRERAGEPQNPPGRPPRPRTLSRDARGDWDFLVAACCKLRVLTEADAAVVELAAETRAEVRRYARKIAKDGASMEYDRQGYMGKEYAVEKAHHLIQPMHSAKKILAGLLQQLGLTPAARARVRAIEPETNRSDDPLAEMGIG